MASESEQAGRTGRGGRGRGGADTGGILGRVSRRGSQAQEAESAEQERAEPREAERPEEAIDSTAAQAGARGAEGGLRGRSGAPPKAEAGGPPAPRNGEAPTRTERSGARSSAGGQVAGGRVADGAGDFSIPSGEAFGEFLDRGLTGERRPKDYSAPAISDHHADILDEDRRLLKELGYSRRQLSVGNMIELAVELQHEYIRRLVQGETRR